MEVKRNSESFDLSCTECINIQIYSQISENIISQSYTISVMKNVSNYNAPVQEYFHIFLIALRTMHVSSLRQCTFHRLNPIVI